MANEQNLQKFTKDNAAQMGAKGGRNKRGSKHISTHIREMLDDPNFELKLKDGTIMKGAPLTAILKTAIVKAASGDMRAFDMLCKYGYGEKLSIAMDGDIKMTVVRVEGAEFDEQSNKIS